MGVTMVALAEHMDYKYEMLRVDAFTKEKPNTCQDIYMVCVRDPNAPQSRATRKTQGDVRVEPAGWIGLKSGLEVAPAARSGLELV